MRDSVVRNRINLNKIIKKERKRQYGIILLLIMLILISLSSIDCFSDRIPDSSWSFVVVVDKRCNS